MSLSTRRDGFVPGLLEAMEALRPEHLAGTSWQQEYASLAPDPDAFPALVEKVKELNRRIAEWPPDAIRSIEAPTLVIVGDSDIVRPEHAVEMFRLMGGGGSADPSAPQPRCQLAILPGTRHEQVVDRAAELSAIVPAFLDGG